MTEQQAPRRVGRFLSAIALLVMLVGLPLGSYIYLKKGYDYQKAALADLRKTHQLVMPEQLQRVAGVSPAQDLSGVMHIIGLLPESANRNYTAYGEVLQQLYEQFDLPANISFWTVFENQDSNFIANYAQHYELEKETAQLIYWTATTPDFSGFIAGLGLNEEELQQLPQGLFVLVDDSRYIRRAYPVLDRSAIQHLVERIAILLPERSKPAPELRREVEK